MGFLNRLIEFTLIPAVVYHIFVEKNAFVIDNFRARFHRRPALSDFYANCDCRTSKDE